MGYFDSLKEEQTKPAGEAETILGAVVRYKLGGAAPYVVEQAIPSGKRRVVFHRPINRGQKRPELTQFGQTSGKFASPAGAILLHEGAYRVKPDDVPEIFPEITAEQLEDVRKAKAEIWSARWTHRIPAGAQAMSGYIHIDAGAVPKPDEQAEFKPGRPPLHFIPAAAKIVASPEELRQALGEVFVQPWARARLFMLAHDGGGHDEAHEMTLASDKTGQEALAALHDKIAKAEAALANPQVAVAVAAESSHWLGLYYKQAIAKGDRTLPPCQQGWYPATIIAETRDGAPPVVTKVVASQFGVEEQTPYKDKLLARIGERLAENAPAYTPQLAAEDAARAGDAATDEACDDMARALGAAIKEEQPGETPSQGEQDPDRINLDIF